MHPRSLITPLSALALGLGLMAGPADADAPNAYEGPSVIPGVGNQAAPIAATAPDGTDVVVYIGDSAEPGTVEYRARIRVAGTGRWRAVPPPAKNRPALQDQVITALGGGDFAMAWVQFAGPAPTVWWSTLDSSRRSWSKPRRAFSDADYNFSTPRIAANADGKVVIGATATTKEFLSPPRNRAIVTVKIPFEPLEQTFLSPASDNAAMRSVSIGTLGHALATFTRGFSLAELRPYAATRGSDLDSPWVRSELAGPGSAQNVTGAIGDGGRAAVAWPTPAAGATGLDYAVARVGEGSNRVWTDGELTTSYAELGGIRIGVALGGDVTFAWDAPTGLSVRHLDGTTLGSTVDLSPGGSRDRVQALRVRPDGFLSLLHARRPSASPGAAPTLFMTVLDAAAVQSTTLLTDPADGNVQPPSFGVDASSRGSIVYAEGSSPYEVVWLGQEFAGPSVMTSPVSGREVRRARVSPFGPGRLRCESGFWVEASSFDYRWLRNGKRIRGATKATYSIVGRDKGKKLTCRVIGSDSADRDVRLTSRPKQIRR